MGAKLSCFSNHGGILSQQPHQPAPVRVIAADGSLKELPASPRVTVSNVLGGNAASFFVCSSDALYFDQSPPALASGEVLQAGQIYFVLPAALLWRPLSSAEMASLAKPQRRRGRLSGGRKKVRVMPMHEEVEDGEDVLLNEKLNERTLGEFAVSPMSPEKIGVVAARSRLKMKLKRALSIIQEVAE
ncbi:hypothetical protein VPH35_116560 [Triticum aestivum]